ncbi:LysR family transcriptional regulator [Fodinicola feengrottensis]|uniref:LysR family transcriptional regulator n=1 Tax=Fodinicola feengrottensis TaxID=435914 RepID=UPI00244349CD|nr:LysR family transcriptional regulator [Fodinicola feengrottensis]
MPVVSLDLLRTFHAVYRARTLTRAALELGLSQPTVTSQLRSLEQAVDQPLFTRQARGVVPTAAADDDLARRLDGPLDALVGIAAELGRSPALAGRTLHLGGPAELVAVRALPALAGTIAAGVAGRAYQPRARRRLVGRSRRWAARSGDQYGTTAPPRPALRAVV